MRKIILHFIKYPIAVNVIVLAFIIFGYFGITNMRSSFFPLVETNMITIQMFYPGASPQEMEEGVVMKIENNLKGLVGVDRFTSKSMENSAMITVETLTEFDIDMVLADVKNAVDKVPSFPTGMEPPVISKQEVMNEVVSFVVSGKNIPLKALKTVARDVESDLRGLEGISQVKLSGFPAEEIEIAVDDEKLRAYNLSFNEVSSAVSKANILITGGSVKTDAEEYLIRANNRNYHGEELLFTVVKADENGKVVYLKDVATVRDRWSEIPDISYYNRESSVRVSVSCTNSEDYIPISEKVVEYIDNFNDKHDNIGLHITRNGAITLKERTKLLSENGALGILMVVLLLSLFLKPRLALWVAFGLPISFLGMFVFASSLNVTINVLSLFGMIIVIGILVDDGIVIAENIYNHYERGKKPIQAAIDGISEVISPIVSAIITTLIAFSAFFFIDGRMGDFFSEVSTIVILTLGISLFEALVILPSHLAHSKALSRNQKNYVFNVRADQFMVWMRDRLYGPVLKFFMKNKLLGFAIPIGMLIMTVGALMGGVIRFTFFPMVASDRIQITLEMPQGTNEKITTKVITRIEDAVNEVSKDFTKRQTGNEEVVQSIIKSIGPGSASANLRVNLLPGESRDFSSDEIANAIQKKTGPVPEAETLIFSSGGNFAGRPVSISIVGENISDIKAAKKELKQILKENPVLKNISDTDPEGIKEIKLQLKEKAHLLGLTLQDVMNQVRSGFFGMQVQRFQRGQDEIKVWVRFKRTPRSSMQSLFDMRIQTPRGSRVPLGEIAEYTIERGEISISHINGKREIKIEADMISKKESATDVVQDIKDNIFPKLQKKYPTISASYEGQNREAAKVGKSAAKVIPIILFLIYAVIAFSFRSYGQPLLLLLMVPFSLIGVGWGHWIHGLPINVLSFLGIIALIGIVVNDGLVLISKFNLNLKAGMKFNVALYKAAKSRFRAIFLTTLTTVAGLAPLMLETSRQAQFLIPMAVSVAYGITIATFLTLLMLPLMISLGNATKVYTKWLFTGTKPTQEEVERAIKEKKSENYELD